MYTDENFMEIILLRPAKYNGQEFELKVSFNDDFIRRTSIREAEELGFTLGDTVEIFGKAKIANDLSDEMHFITLYLCDDVIDEFFEKVGVANISYFITCKARLVYRTYERSNLTGTKTETDEMVGFQLTELLTAREILSEEEKDYYEFVKSFFTNSNEEE